MSEDSMRIRQLENDLATTQRALAMMIDACSQLATKVARMETLVNQIAVVSASYMSMTPEEQAKFRESAISAMKFSQNAVARGPREPTDTQLDGVKPESDAILRAIMGTNPNAKKGDVH